MKNILFITILAFLASGCSQPTSEKSVVPDQVADVSGWHANFIDEFDTFNPENWQDQPIWVNKAHKTGTRLIKARCSLRGTQCNGGGAKLQCNGDLIATPTAKIF